MNSEITSMKTGFIIEDNADAQQYLYEVLKESFPDIEVDFAFSLKEAYQYLDAKKPDIALVDLNLPDGTGVELLRRVKDELPHCISVVTTIYDDDDHLFSALRAGAQGYLLKEQKREFLIEALQGVTEGKPALTPKIALKMMDHFSHVEDANSEDSLDAMDQLLSKREKQVLQMIAKGFSVKHVADDLNISHHTVASHVKNIYSKLEITSRAEATYKAVQLGLAD